MHVDSQSLYLVSRQQWKVVGRVGDDVSLRRRPVNSGVCVAKTVQTYTQNAKAAESEAEQVPIQASVLQRIK